MDHLSPQIDELVSRMHTLGAVRVGKGPYHPTEPAIDLEPHFRQLLATFPFLASIQDYTTFIGRYGGAAVADFDNNCVIDIFGIVNLSSNLLDYPGSPLDTNGFYSFASGQFWPHGPGKMRDIITCSFMFNSTEPHTPGVYRQILIPGSRSGPIHFRRTAPELCWPTFSAWLEWIIQNRGAVTSIPAE